MGGKEKTMLIVTLLLLAILIPKSLFFDEAKVTGDQLTFKKFVEKAVNEEERYNGFLRKKNITSYRVVSVKKISDEGVTLVQYYDGEKNKDVEEEIMGKYRAKVRGYFLHVIPYKEFKVESAK